MNERRLYVFSSSVYLSWHWDLFSRLYRSHRSRRHQDRNLVGLAVGGRVRGEGGETGERNGMAREEKGPEGDCAGGGNPLLSILHWLILL